MKIITRIVCSRCLPTCGRHAVHCEGYRGLAFGLTAGQQVEPKKVSNGEHKS